jgi:hypothetical protein
MKAITILVIFALAIAANSWTYAGHSMSGDASAQVKAGIKATLYIDHYLA